jgi:hypothetical protein
LSVVTRRDFLSQAALGAMLAALAPDRSPAQRGQVTDASTGARIKLMRRDETTLRLGGEGDDYHMSWGMDDRQFVAVCDGVGWLDRPKGIYNSRLFAVSGEPQNASFTDIPGYPELIPLGDGAARYYGFGTLALEGRIYQYLATPNHSFGQADPRFIGAKLIYSPDNGKTWGNQNGSSPVVWEPWTHRSRDNMVFFEEQQDAFSLLSILQMGRHYEANRDGFVYVYAPNGNTEGTMNQLVMFRVRKARMLAREHYEYFAGTGRNGAATWTCEIGARAVVHTFPSGWVNKSVHPWSWIPSLTYNAPLGLYMMVNWGTGCAPDGSWFGKPSYLGFWTARDPWGPWMQIHEETAWLPDGDSAARAYSPQIAPKWVAPDGKSFWLVWSDFQKKDDNGDLERLEADLAAKIERKQTLSENDAVRVRSVMARAQPYYSFNAQRVDLELA